MRSALRRTLFAGLFACFSVAQAADPIAIDIAAQPLARALAEFAEQSGIKTLYAADLLTGKQAPRVVGDLSPQQALERLLDGSGLRYEFVGDAVVKIDSASSSGGEMKSSQVAGAGVAMLPSISVVGERSKMSISMRNEALPGSVQVIDAEQIETQHVENYLDLFRKQPGMNTQAYGQGGVVDGISMRGFSAGAHSHQIAVFVDGIPVNLTNHAGHGYANFAWIRPEMIERIEIVRGPISALYGNFALGGTINITTKSAVRDKSISLETGSHESHRASVTYGENFSSVSPFVVFDVVDRKGYRDNSEDRRYNLLGKLAFTNMDNGLLSVSMHAQNEDFNAPGYISLNAIQNGDIERTSASDPTDGGTNKEVTLGIRYTPKVGEAGWHGTLYFSDNELERWSSFSSGPQSYSHNMRSFGGWNVFYNYMPSDQLQIAVGADGRYDDNDRLVFNSVGRVNVSAAQDWRIKELSAGLFAQSQYKVHRTVKLAAGLRYDSFETEIVNHLTSANSGTGKSDLVSPKLGLTWSPTESFVAYANRARGFRSPAAHELSPASGGTPRFDLDMATLETVDVGFNFQITPQLNLDFNHYWTKTEREIRVIAGESFNVGTSDRNGYELMLAYNPVHALSFFMTYSEIDAKVTNPATPGADRLSGLPETYLTLGGTWVKPLARSTRLVFDFYGQRLGDTPMDTTGTVVRGPFWRYMGKISYMSDRISVFGGATYQPDEDIGETMFGDTFAPMPKVSANVGFKYSF